VRGVSIKELVRRTGLSRNTIRVALRALAAPKYERVPAGSKLDVFKGEIHALLRDDRLLTGQRIRELIAPLGFVGGRETTVRLTAFWCSPRNRDGAHTAVVE
jgi:hypothetical protein